MKVLEIGAGWQIETRCWECHSLLQAHQEDIEARRKTTPTERVVHDYYVVCPVCTKQVFFTEPLPDAVKKAVLARKLVDLQLHSVALTKKSLPGNTVRALPQGPVVIPLSGLSGALKDELRKALNGEVAHFSLDFRE